LRSGVIFDHSSKLYNFDGGGFESSLAATSKPNTYIFSRSITYSWKSLSRLNQHIHNDRHIRLEALLCSSLKLFRRTNEKALPANRISEKIIPRLESQTPAPQPISTTPFFRRLLLNREFFL
jgi:hypothetical protein